MERLIKATENSWRGLLRAMRTEPAVAQEMLVLVIGAVLANVLAQDFAEWVWLVSPLLVLLAIELLNTAIEKLCDRLIPEQDDAVGYVKDLGSAAVFAALVLTALIWLPVLLRFLWNDAAS